MTKLEFLEKARNVHGYKYNYLDIPTKIRLSDKIRLELNSQIFTQSVSKHLKGRCPEKTTAKKTTEDFILESKSIWGDKYDYSLVDYNGSLNDVKIIHNGTVYQQRASSHLKGMAPEFQNQDVKYGTDYITTKSEIESFLKKHKLEFFRNYIFEKRIFDFYVPSVRTCIEIGPVIDIDNKNNYCEEHYLNLIVIKDDRPDDIPQILWENLKVFIRMKR